MPYDPNDGCNPSVHNAPFNEEEYWDENGEEQVRCGCFSCSRARRREAAADYAIDRDR